MTCIHDGINGIFAEPHPGANALTSHLISSGEVSSAGDGNLEPWTPFFVPAASSHDDVGRRIW